MDDQHQERPTTNKPLNGPRKGAIGPAFAVLGLVIVVVVIFAVITLLRYNS
ncbi:hypothetical protein [Nocardioides pantholopis]|uniref:hypothetical protein n=1 Tax=Nocardioides pantholopis TaxID=2483798 RepID=UPI0013DDE76B|nr:hypothetical protein [Nocardioides pantholopis]